MSDLHEAILSPDQQVRNQALKSLYMDPIVNGKVIDWARQFKLTRCEPDDIIQEAIILMDEKIRTGGFAGKSKVRTFLLGICFNMIRDQHKKVNRVDLKAEFHDSEQMPEELQYDFIEFQEKTQEDAERTKLLAEAFQHLSQKCQDALSDYYFNQLSMATIAAKRAYSSVQIAKTAVHRCRERLRKYIFQSPELTKKAKELL